LDLAQLVLNIINWAGVAAVASAWLAAIFYIMTAPLTAGRAFIFYIN